MDLEIALQGGWVRYWYQGDLLPLPADLQRDLERTKVQLESANRRADEATRRADNSALRMAELERLLAAEKEARQSAEAESAKSRAALERHGNRPNGSKPK
jgi:hypothetical protein